VFALAHDVGMVEREVEAGVDDLNGGLRRSPQRNRFPARAQKVGGDVHGEHVRAHGQTLDRPARGATLPGAEHGCTVRLEDRHPLPRDHRRIRIAEAQHVARRQTQRARHDVEVAATQAAPCSPR
jgi:hypothetical protein